MIEGGLNKHWHDKYWSSSNMCKDNLKGQGARNLTLDDLQSAFLVLAVGVTMATLIFLAENLVHLIAQCNRCKMKIGKF